MTPFYSQNNITLYNADCLDVLRQMPDNSVSSCLTDPPYGLTDELDITELLTHWLAGEEYQHGKSGFMGQLSDVVPGPAIWREVWRVLKPGGALFAFGGTRTVDLLSIAIRLAGFQKFDEISYHYDQLDWVYGQGMCKSTSISKQLDKAAIVPCPACSDEPLEPPSEQSARLRRAMQKENNEGSGCLVCNGTGTVKGAEREVVGKSSNNISETNNANTSGYSGGYGNNKDITAPATPAAVEWDGYGTAFSPGHEVVLCCWKPRVGTYAENALEWGVAGLNVDAGRIGTDASDPNHRRATGENGGADSMFGVGNHQRPATLQQGRWPKNWTHDDSPQIRAEFDKAGVRTSGKIEAHHKARGICSGSYSGGKDGSLNSQHGPSYGDSGSAARFFYASKADKSQRPFYCHECQAVFEAKTRPHHKHGHDNWGHITSHPTQKPESIINWLLKMLIPPKGGVILDPFCGSGTTLKVANDLGVKAIGIDLERPFCEITKYRLRQPTLWPVEEPPQNGKEPVAEQGKLL